MREDSRNPQKFRFSIKLVVTLLLLLTFSSDSASGATRMTLSMSPSVAVTSPPVILQSGTMGNNTVYMNGTSAKVNVAALCNVSSTYDYVLQIVNQVADNWTVNLQVYNSYDIERLSSLNISLHDDPSSDQIIVSNGSITRSQGAPYNLPGGLGSTLRISLNDLQANTTDTSYIQVYLKVLAPNTTTYPLYAITFEIT